MKKRRIILIVLIALALIIQLIPANRPDVVKNNPNDLLSETNIPDSIRQLLKTSCYDCHSNESVYPWYSYVAPVSWLVASDVREGRKHLNFSDWKSFDKIEKAKSLEDISDEVSEGDMPMQIFTIMHPNAKLSDKDREIIVNWVEAYGESLFD